jgi:hypothetical protein
VQRIAQYGSHVIAGRRCRQASVPAIHQLTPVTTDPPRCPRRPQPPPQPSQPSQPSRQDCNPPTLRISPLTAAAADTPEARACPSRPPRHPRGHHCRRPRRADTHGSCPGTPRCTHDVRRRASRSGRCGCRSRFMRRSTLRTSSRAVREASEPLTSVSTFLLMSSKCRTIDTVAARGETDFGIFEGFFAHVLDTPVAHTCMPDLVHPPPCRHPVALDHSCRCPTPRRGCSTSSYGEKENPKSNLRAVTTSES